MRARQRLAATGWRISTGIGHRPGGIPAAGGNCWLGCVRANYVEPGVAGCATRIWRTEAMCGDLDGTGSLALAILGHHLHWIAIAQQMLPAVIRRRSFPVAFARTHQPFDRCGTGSLLLFLRRRVSACRTGRIDSDVYGALI